MHHGGQAPLLFPPHLPKQMSSFAREVNGAALAQSSGWICTSRLTWDSPGWCLLAKLTGRSQVSPLDDHHRVAHLSLSRSLVLAALQGLKLPGSASALTPASSEWFGRHQVTIPRMEGSNAPFQAPVPQPSSWPS